MEELLSTEALDREILEDARKKAMRILKTADETLEAQKADWDKKIQDALESIRNIYAQRIKRSSGEILARLPLDKRRLRAETAEGFLVRAMDDFFSSRSREMLLSVLEKELAQRLNACVVDGEGTIFYSGMSLSEAEGVFKKISSSAYGPFGSGDMKFKEDPVVHKFPSIVIDTRALRINASVEGAAASLMRDKRAELAAALLGGGALND